MISVILSEQRTIHAKYTYYLRAKCVDKYDRVYIPCKALYTEKLVEINRVNKPNTVLFYIFRFTLLYFTHGQ